MQRGSSPQLQADPDDYPTLGMQLTSGSIALLLAALMSGPGCRDNPAVSPRPLANAKAETVLSETGSFAIGSDTYGAEFGTITVRECRNKPTSRLISVPFLRVLSKAARPAEPIFALAGGPGHSNMAWSGDKVGVLLPEHDFVVVGYRGADGSAVLDCPEVGDAVGADDDPLSDESMIRIGQAWTNSAERLTAEGVDLDGYTMLETIEDNEAVRRALGYERINLLSESYGTRIAYLYGLRHPQSLHRSVMIAVNPPGHFVWEPQTIDRQLRQYAKLAAEDSALALRTPDLYATIRTVLNDMPRRWLIFPIDPGRVKVATFALLFHRNTAATVFDAYVAAEHGDPSGLALMSLAYDYVIPTIGIWGDLASKAASADRDATRDFRPDRGTPELPLGSPMNLLSWGPLAYGRWPTRMLPDEFRKPRASDVETLLLSGNLDFSTPAEFAATELLPFLTKGRQVVLSDCGHVGDVWNVHGEATKRMLTTFYRTGTPDLSLNTHVPMDFSVAWSFPRIARTAVGSAALLIIGLAALIVRSAARRRRSATARAQKSLA